MKKYFICLANSKKFRERCVAGIEVTKNNTGSFSIVEKGNRPKWIRPVTEYVHGAVPENIAGEMHLLDVYKIKITEECPEGYQSENVKFKRNSLKRISRISHKSTNLDVLIETSRDTIFTNRGKAVPKEKIKDVSYSLVLIKAVNPEVYQNNEFGKN